MSRFEVDSAQVASASSAVQSSVLGLTSEVDRMNRNLLDLQSSWRGQAATQFQAVAEEWRRTQDQVKASLEQISQALAAAATTYADAEAQAMRMFAR